jgi:DNA-directed RNA polymerase subunit RPC12/RpoP
MCPACGEKFELDTELYDEGDLIECNECGTSLTVIKRNNKLSVVETESSDAWEDEEEEEFEVEEE